MYILLCLKWITNKDLPCCTWNSALCNVAAWVGGEFGGEWIHVSIAKSLHSSPETVTTFLMGYTPIQNKKGFVFLLKKKKEGLLYSLGMSLPTSILVH